MIEYSISPYILDISLESPKKNQNQFAADLTRVGNASSSGRAAMAVVGRNDADDAGGGGGVREGGAAGRELVRQSDGQSAGQVVSVWIL